MMSGRSLSAAILIALYFGFGTGIADGITEQVIPPSVLFELLALNRDLPTLKKPKYLSPTDLVVSPDGRKLYVAQQTGKRIDVIDFEQETAVNRFLLPNEVTGLAVAPDGSKLYATCSSDWWPNGMVCMVDIAFGRVIDRIPVGHGARAPVITPEGSFLYVCNRYDNSVSVIDVAARKELRRIPAIREPYCADITPDGETVVVGNLLPADRATDTLLVASMITCIDAASGEVKANIRLPVGSHSVQGIEVSPDGRYAFATHLAGHFNLIGTTVENGWLHTNNLAVIDLNELRLLNDLSLDHETKGAGNPWSVGFSPDGTYLCVTHAGSDELSVIDYISMLDTVIQRTALGEDLSHDFTVLQSCHRIVTTDLRSPRALAVTAEYAYTAGYFSDELPVVAAFELDDPGKRPVTLMGFDAPRSWNGERNGASNVCDAKLCFQNWQSCYSCHPFNRPDGLNWILGGGAIVCPKNTRSFVYSWWTPPVTWGGRRHAQQNIVSGIELELFRAATRDLTYPIDTLFMYLRPVPSPYLEKGVLSAAAQRGRELFHDTTRIECLKCHRTFLFTDNMSWNTGIPDPFDANPQWVTPSLPEAWRTDPYNHLGSMTLREVIMAPTHNNAGEKLSTDEIDDLVAYVLSL
jgi:YVTN family beta-propeller protein